MPGAGDHAAVDLVGGLGGFPLNLVDRVRGQDVEFDRVAEHAVDYRLSAGRHRGCWRLALWSASRAMYGPGVDLTQTPS